MGKAKNWARAQMERNKRLVEAGEKPPPEKAKREREVLPGSYEAGKRR